MKNNGWIRRYKCWISAAVTAGDMIRRQTYKTELILWSNFVDCLKFSSWWSAAPCKPSAWWVWLQSAFRSKCSEKANKIGDSVCLAAHSNSSCWMSLTGRDKCHHMAGRDKPSTTTEYLLMLHTEVLHQLKRESSAGSGTLWATGFFKVLFKVVFHEAGAKNGQ